MRTKKCISIYVTPHLYSIIKSKAEKGMRSMGSEVLHCLRECYQREDEEEQEQEQDKWNKALRVRNEKEK